MTMLARLGRISDAVNHAVILVCVACVATMLAISFVGFFYMISTGDALSWTYSLARLFIPWIGLLSITVAFKRGEHVAMSVLVKRLPRSVAAVTGYANIVLIGIFAVLLIWLGWEFFLNSTQYYMVSDKFQVHHRWVAACVPVSGVILLIHLASGPSLLEPPIDAGEGTEQAPAAQR